MARTSLILHHLRVCGCVCLLEYAIAAGHDDAHRGSLVRAHHLIVSLFHDKHCSVSARSAADRSLELVEAGAPATCLGA